MKSFSMRALTLSVALLLSACGGGGGGSTVMAPMALDLGVGPLPEHTPPVPDPQVPVEMNNLDFGYSTDYIKTAMRNYAVQSNGAWRPMIQPSVIRPAVGTSNEVVGALVLAVHAMNAWLPYEQHIRIGASAPFTRDPSQVATGEIILNESSIPLPDLSPDTLGYAQSDYTADGNYLRAGTILLTSTLQYYPEEQIISVLLHEMLHTMGMYGHLNPEAFPDSIMSPTITDDVYLPPFDGLTLLMGYTQLRPNSSAAEIAATDLGPWAENTPSLLGSIEACACFFGADLIGGHAVSWIAGEPPGMFVQDLGLNGTATWVGKMVGWTTSQEAVWSDMNLGVSLDSFNGTSLDGQVEFDNISFYESGTQWGDGELAYDILVPGGFYFASRLDNPEGYVFGAFAGTYLEGAVGTLEHPELTGAFGGTR